MPLSTRAYLKKLNREVNRIQDAIMPVETKYYQEAQSGFVNSGVGSASTFASVEPFPIWAELPVGDGQGERVGDAIKQQNMSVRGTIEINSTDNQMSAIVRSIFFNVPDDSMTVEATGAGWVNIAAGAGQRQYFDFAGPLQPKSLSTRYLSNVISDKVYALSTTGSRIVHIEDVYHMNNVIRWDPNVADGYPNQNALYHLMTCNINSTNTSILPEINFTYYGSYTDV